MNYNPDIHHRKSIRLKGYDYTNPGAYFITICSKNRTCLFGRIDDGTMLLNEFGQAVRDVWEWLPEQYQYVTIGEFIIMPNHFHGILIIGRGGSRTAHIMPDADKIPDNDVLPDTAHGGGSRTAPTDKQKSVGRLIGVFKTVSTKRMNIMRSDPVDKIWQRNYYEHIIRNDDERRRIEEYIANNPMTWKDDRLFAE